MRKHFDIRGGTGRTAMACIAALIPCAVSAPAAAQGGTAATAAAQGVTPATTAAGTRIDNTASLAFGQADDARRVTSNTVSLVVDERLDVTIAADHAVLAVVAADAVLPAGFMVANTGNGAGAFALAASADRDMIVAGLAIDSDGDGAYDAARDAVLAGGTITLAAGERRRVFVLVRNAVQAGGRVALSVTAAKGHGTPGTVVAGAGQGGGDAIVGPTGASATAATTLVGGADAAPRLDKFQSVVAPDGTPRARPGAIITYRLEARFAGPTPAVAITDAIPAGTVFVPGSITLDGRPLTDAADADLAAFDGSTVRVAIGDVAAAGVRTVQFQTRIQ